MVEKIVDGQLKKWAKEVALLEQEHVRSDRYEGKTIEQLRAEIAAKTGENIRIARFARFVVGERVGSDARRAPARARGVERTPQRRRDGGVV